MSKGVVKFFNATKGWGFVTDEESGRDIFVHVTGLVDRVSDGEAVTFDIEDGNRGVKAINVKRSSGQPTESAAEEQMEAPAEEDQPEDSGDQE